MPIPSFCGERRLRRSRTGWIPPSPLVQINLYQGEILPYNTELVGQAFGSLVGWIVREDRSSAFQSERGQVHRPTEQILLGNQVQLYQVILGVNFGYLFCTRGESDLAPGPTPYAVGGEPRHPSVRLFGHQNRKQSVSIWSENCVHQL